MTTTELFIELTMVGYFVGFVMDIMVLGMGGVLVRAIRSSD